jgi:two-component system, OmpR family, sensor histidine kinase KdpD
MADSKHPQGYGKHKIFLGYSPGIGKTYQMLEESVRRKQRGQDVVIGLVSTHGREGLQEMVKQLESIPPRLGKLNLEAILARKPQVVLVDDIQLPVSPGAPEKRWQDVETLLRKGISVLSTLDVIHLESLNDTVTEITGLRPEHTVPDHILAEAEEVEYVDLTPRALLNRIERGAVFKEGLTKDQHEFFRMGNLSAMREIAMREVAQHVDEDLAEYRKEKRIEKPWATRDRVLVCLSPTRSSLRLIRRGWRMGQRMHGDVFAVHVEEGPIGERERRILDEDFKLCSRLGIEVRVLKGSVTESVIKFAQEKNVTSVILGHPERSRLKEIFRPSILSELARTLRNADIIVVAQEAAPDHNK